MLEIVSEKYEIVFKVVYKTGIRFYIRFFFISIPDIYRAQRYEMSRQIGTITQTAFISIPIAFIVHSEINVNVFQIIIIKYFN